MLHGVRLKSFAPVDAIADLVGLPLTEVEAELADLQQRELVRYREGALTGWTLTPAGRKEGERLLADELDGYDLRAAVDGCYRRFLELNQPLLGVCTDWQLRPDGDRQIINDHADAAWDGRVLDALRGIDRRVQPIVADLADVLDRFAGYGPRFTVALGRVEAGEPDWFTKPTLDSYHTVWFELHENLLATLGIERSKEM